jgi:osmotically inducible protein OsmC
MSLSNLITEAGGSPDALEVTADVTLGADPAGGFRLTDITLTVVGEVDGVDEPTFLELAEKAKSSCPISKALTGVPMTLKASLA